MTSLQLFQKVIDVLDEIKFPTFAVPALPHAYPSRLGICAFATGLFNMLDCPAGIVPTGTVTSDDDRLLADEASWHTGTGYVLLSSIVNSWFFRGLFLQI